MRSPALPPLARLFVQSLLFWSALNITSLLPPYLIALGASQTFVGIYSILGVLLIVVVVVLAGGPLVRLRRVRWLRHGYLILAVASLLAWALPTSLPWLMAMKLVASVSQVFASTLMNSLMFDLSPPGRRAQSLSFFSISGMLTNPLAALGGETVVRLWGAPALFLVASGLALGAWSWSWLVREPEVRDKTDEAHSFFAAVVRRDVRPLVILSFMFGTYFSALATFLPHHTQTTLGHANLSAFMIPFSLISILIRLVLGPQLDRRAPRRFLAWSFGAVGVAMVLLLLPPAWAWIAAAGLFYGLGHSVLFPLLNTLFVQVGGEEQKSVYSNAFTVVNLLGAVVMTPLLGALGDALGFEAAVVVLLLLALTAVLVVRSGFARPAADPPSARNS